MVEIPTLKIVSLKDPEKFWNINKSDFDPTIHTLWKDKDRDILGPEDMNILELKAYICDFEIEPVSEDDRELLLKQAMLLEKIEEEADLDADILEDEDIEDVEVCEDVEVGSK